MPNKQSKTEPRHIIFKIQKAKNEKKKKIKSRWEKLQRESVKWMTKNFPYLKHWKALPSFFIIDYNC